MLVGRQKFDRAQGTNQAFNAAGNMFAALALGAVSYYFNLRWMSYFVGTLCVGAVCAAHQGQHIDFDQARGASKAAGKASGDLAIANLTKGTGSFNAAQGAIATAQGLGALVNNLVADYLAKKRSDNFAFLTLAAIAAVGLICSGYLSPKRWTKPVVG